MGRLLRVRKDSSARHTHLMKPLSLSHPFPLLHVPSHSPNSARRKSSWRTSSSTRTTTPPRRGEQQHTYSSSTHTAATAHHTPLPSRAHSGDSLVVNPVVAAKMALESAEGRTHGDHKLRPGARGALKKLFGKVHAHMKRHAAKPAQPLSNSLAPDNPLTLTLSLSPYSRPTRRTTGRRRRRSSTRSPCSTAP